MGAGWTNIPLAAGDSAWASITTWAELFGAWNERRKVLGQVEVTAPAKGDVIASHALIEQMQDWVEAYADQFVCTYVDGVRVENFHGEDVDSSAPYSSHVRRLWTWATLASAVLTNSNWRRKKVTGAEAGQMDKNYYASYIELMNDLRLVFDELVWTYPASWSMRSALSKWGTGSIIATAEAAYLADGGSTRLGNTGCWYIIQKDAAGDLSVSVQRRSTVWVVNFEAHLLPVGTALAVAANIDWYARGRPPSGSDEIVFDDNGEGYIENKWTVMDTKAAVVGATEQEFANGSLGLPTAPTPPVAEGSVTRGYYAAVPCPIIRWDFDYK